MNDAHFEELKEASWRRRLTPEESAQVQAWLARHPERRAEWEAEQALNRALTSLPDAPVSSNFTSLVLQAARREAARPGPVSLPWWRQAFAWLHPRPATGVAGAALLLCAAWFGWHQNQVLQRNRHAQDLTALSSAAALPEPQLLAADFETLRRLPQAEADDDELLAVLQETAANP